MRVIDTSAWIEFLLDSETGKMVAPEMPRRDDCIVQLELAKWLAREASQELRRAVLPDASNGVVVPLDTDLALQATEIFRNRRLATADAIIYATAQAYYAERLTCDAHFKDLPGVLYFPRA